MFSGMGNNGYNDEGDFVDGTEIKDFTEVDFSHASLFAGDIKFNQLETAPTWYGPDFTGATVQAVEGDLQFTNNWLRETDFSSASLSGAAITM